jgi:GNAT superfamily N-acetyltransferase
MRYQEFARPIVNEIETNAQMGDDAFIDHLHKDDFSGRQLDLFREIPSLEPDIPPNYKFVGRLGEFFVAKRNKERGNPYTSYVFFNRDSALGYVSLAAYDRSASQYPAHAPEAPELSGIGLRIHGVQVQPKFRGQGLGLKMYKWLLENVCDYLMADDVQTPDGVALWKRLQAQSNIFTVEVWDGEKFESRFRKRGRDFNYVYDKCHLIPWVTIPSKYEMVIEHPDNN